MHSAHFKMRGYKLFVIHHNGDWSGSAIVVWQRDGEVEAHEVELPADVLIAAGDRSAKEAMRSKIIDFVEAL